MLRRGPTRRAPSRPGQQVSSSILPTGTTERGRLVAQPIRAAAGSNPLRPGARSSILSPSRDNPNDLSEDRPMATGERLDVTDVDDSTPTAGLSPTRRQWL